LEGDFGNSLHLEGDSLPFSLIGVLLLSPPMFQLKLRHLVKCVYSNLVFVTISNFEFEHYFRHR
jgi:hypothetical protein